MAKNYGYDSGVLAVGINAASEALTNMRTVEQKVRQLTDQIRLVNNSNSGGMLTTRFSDWNSHFQKVVTALDTLNNKVIETSKTNTRTGDDADVTAR